MMEHNTDRMFWTMAVLIVGAILLTLGIRMYSQATTASVSTGSNVVNIVSGNTVQRDKDGNLKPVVDDDSDEVVKFQQQVTDLANKNKTKDLTIASLQNTINTVQAQNSQLSSQVSATISVADQQNTVNQNAINSAKAQNDALYQQVQDKINDTKTKLNNYQTDIGNKLSTINDLKNKIYTLNAQNAGQTDQNSYNVDQQISDLKTQLTSQQNQLTQLQQAAQQQTSDLNNAITQAQSQYIQIQAQLGLDKNTIAGSNAQVTNLLTKLNTLLNKQWNNLTPDQQNYMINTYWSQISDAIKVVWVPTHFSSLSDSNKTEFAKQYPNLVPSNS